MASWFSLGLADFTLVALIGILAGAIGGWFSKYWFPSVLQHQRHELDIKSETHRAEMKRREMLFASELKAAESLLSFVDHALDQFAGPDHDDPDLYYDGIARDFESLEKKISLLVRKHEAALPDAAVDLLKTARTEAKRGSHSYARDEQGTDVPTFDLSDHTIAHATKLEGCLREASATARSDLRKALTANDAPKA